MPEPSSEESASAWGRPPAVGALLARPEVSALVEEHGHLAVVEALRAAVAELRQGPGGAATGPTDEELVPRTKALLRHSPRRLHQVINGTGVVIHTNLGRAPLGAEIAARAAKVASGYSNVELDETTGRRGDRQDLLSTLLCQLGGAEAAMVVNNGAAAVLLALAALCRGREVLVSRGESIEIGGGFRIPDILRLSGARLVDIGTTNRTRVADYLEACGTRTAAFLRVHQSNFSMQGFVVRPEVGELAEAAHERGVLLLEDVGSGLIGPATKSVAAEDRLRTSLGAGVDLVFCSGDKLLGGSQAGLLLGRRALIARLRRYPLARALRPDKLQLAVLEETLLCHASPGRLEEVPVWKMLRTDPDQLQTRAKDWSNHLAQAGIATEVVGCEGAVGGGTTPGVPLPSFGLLLPDRRPRRLRQRLLRGQPPVVALEGSAGVVIDARCVLPGEDQALLAAIRVAVERRD